MEKYSLTPEHEEQLYPWHRKWVKIAMRTDPQTEEDRGKMIEAINGLYDAASLELPKHIVFVPSPLVGQIASGFAAAIWWIAENKDKRLDDAPDVTSSATSGATWDATWGVTEGATREATSA